MARMLKLALQRAAKQALGPALGAALVHLLTTHLQEGTIAPVRTLVVSGSVFVAIMLLVFLPLHYQKLAREQRGG